MSEARSILNLRLAKGEITVEQYKELSAALEGGQRDSAHGALPPPSSPTPIITAISPLVPAETPPITQGQAPASESLVKTYLKNVAVVVVLGIASLEGEAHRNIKKLRCRALHGAR
jgi:hypothetical protein